VLEVSQISVENVRVASVQFDVVLGDAEANQQKAAALVEEAAVKGAQIVLLPELWNCGYFLDELPRLAEGKNGKSIALIRKLAAKYKIYIFAGSIAEKKDGKYYNTSYAINDRGDIIAKYRKAHLFSLGLREKEYFTPGDDWVIVDIPFMRVGMLICYDLRFPEYCRNLALRGADLFVVPAQWPKSRLIDWRLFCKVRAIENQCFLISANRTGEDDFAYPGSSMIISPRGDMIAEAGEEEGLIIGDLDLALLQSTREKIPMLLDRRRILDEVDDSQV